MNCWKLVAFVCLEGITNECGEMYSSCVFMGTDMMESLS